MEADYQHVKFEYNLLEGSSIVKAQREVTVLSLLSSTQMWWCDFNFCKLQVQWHIFTNNAFESAVYKVDQ